MNAKKPDISQIRKYLNGELDARAMYELERQAHNDPFLMDVIKGMESSDANHQPNLDAINRLLKERVEQDRKRVIPLYRFWPVAACLLIALTIGGWWLTRKNPVHVVAVNITKEQPANRAKAQPTPIVIQPVSPSAKPMAIAKLRKKYKEPEPIPVVESNESAPTPPAIAADQVKADTNNYIAQNYAKAKDEKPVLKEVMIRGFSTQKKTTVTGSVATITAPDASMAQFKKQSDSTYEKALSGRTAGVAVTDSRSKNTLRAITGRVVTKNDGTPLPGAMISINGKQQATQTNADGSFKIMVPAKAETLDIAFIGFESQHIKLKGQDNLKIELAEDNRSLAEVVVVGYGSPIETTNGAHPVIGWKAYNTYLKENAVTSGNETPVIKLTFTVDARGVISNIRIINGSTDELNQKAINLVTKGPKWVAANNGKPEEVKLKIKFHN